jgi:hypothetical protein
LAIACQSAVIVAWWLGRGVAPDLDVLSFLGGAAAYSEYHHVLTHSVVAAVVGTVIWTACARERWKVLLLSLLAFHVHLLCDLLGSGRDWPIVYFYPFSRHEYHTSLGWPLASPQNALAWLVAVALTVWIGVKRGRTFGGPSCPPARTPPSPKPCARCARPFGDLRATSRCSVEGSLA